MITLGLRLVLLLFALVGFGGAGASLAVARYRYMAEGERDLGMLGVAAMLLTFGALCTTVGVGWMGVPAFGGVVLWVSYVLMAGHLDLFRIETHPSERSTSEAEESRRAD